MIASFVLNSLSAVGSFGSIDHTPIFRIFEESASSLIHPSDKRTVPSTSLKEEKLWNCRENGYSVSLSNKRTLRLYDFSGKSKSYNIPTRVSTRIHSLSCDGVKATILDRKNLVWIWEIGSGKLRKLFDLREIAKRLGFQDPIQFRHRVCLSADGNRLAFGMESNKSRDPYSGDPLSLTYELDLKTWQIRIVGGGEPLGYVTGSVLATDYLPVDSDRASRYLCLFKNTGQGWKKLTWILGDQFASKDGHIFVRRKATLSGYKVENSQI